MNIKKAAAQEFLILYNTSLNRPMYSNIKITKVHLNEYSGMKFITCPVHGNQLTASASLGH
ncbi:hypothetical protein [Clostridium luticellarii]|jgi:hypothetical protein|uniref:hypothetical protein n=1 Tax=Clostridium luticellarii TaxID=1691940 RepID=UPI001474FEBA|nr:hypothetical protein [Clostridium luticellarii]